MENLKKSTIAKIIAVFLTAVFTLVLVFSAFCLTFGVAADLYSGNSTNKTELEEIFFSELHRSGARLIYSSDFENKVFPNGTENIMYEIKDAEGNVLFTNIDENEILYSCSEKYLLDMGRVWDSETPDYEEYVTDVDGEKPSSELTETTSTYFGYRAKRVPYVITVCLKKSMKEKDNFYYISKLYTFISQNEASLVTAAVSSFILSVILFIFLMSSAGHRKDKDGVYISLFDKIPCDALNWAVTGIYTGLFVFTAWTFDEFWNEVPVYMNNSVTPFMIALYILEILAVSVIFTLFCMTLAVRFKTKTLIKSTLVYIVLSFVWKYLKRILSVACRFVKRVFGFFRHAAAQIPTLWKAVLIILAGFIFANIILIFSFDCDSPLLLVVYFVVISIAAFLVCVMFSDIKKSTEKIANGNTDEKINTERLLGDLKRHGENINSINDGIAKAVNEKMKSERFKTELITNVSHDIKTPLTSIINYVDLLSKEEIGNENSEEYIEVLTRQSSKLKKLIDDLLEASKASTGNLTVNFTIVEMGIALSQTLGEYEDRFKSNSLDAIMNKCDEPLYISADNRHMWRIFDNIFNNIVKYAQPNTRVYIDAVKKGGFAEVTFKNISKEPLNISGEELTERFVRGDSSRNTEGSGLGLSIARSLAELQNGQFDVQIDGDLFKVTLKFPIIK